MATFTESLELFKLEAPAYLKGLRISPVPCLTVSVKILKVPWLRGFANQSQRGGPAIWRSMTGLLTT